jgi:hypothetical protein
MLYMAFVYKYGYDQITLVIQRRLDRITLFVNSLLITAITSRRRFFVFMIVDLVVSFLTIIHSKGLMDLSVLRFKWDCQYSMSLLLA